MAINGARGVSPTNVARAASAIRSGDYEGGSFVTSLRAANWRKVSTKFSEKTIQMPVH